MRQSLGKVLQLTHRCFLVIIFQLTKQAGSLTRTQFLKVFLISNFLAIIPDLTDSYFVIGV